MSHEPGPSPGAPGASEARDLLRESFRAAMSHVAGPVSVVTTYTGGRPAGTTVSAFASLSMEPPMMLVSLMRGSSLLTLLSVGSTVGVNVLGSGQTEVASRFASSVDDRFAGVGWRLRGGAPALDGAHAWVALRVVRLVPAGDHVLVLGDVLDAEVEAPDAAAAPGGAGDPLTYHRRSFGTHRAH